MMGTLRRLWDGVLLYFPVVLMGVLALASWWLVRNAPQPPQAPVAKAPRHEVDYQMSDFSVRSFAPDGHLQSEVQGQVARHYPDTDTLEVDQVRIRSQGKNGSPVQATARQAISNADGSEVQLQGDAMVLRPSFVQAGKTQPALEFRGEFLHIWTQQERVRSHLPVTLQRGKDRFSADGLEYDNLSQVLQMRGHVRGQVTPAR